MGWGLFMKPLLIVDSGEEAARKIAGDHYDIVLYEHVKPALVKAKPILYWPTGADATLRAKLLNKHASQVKILTAEGQTPETLETMGWNEWLAWARPRVIIFTVQKPDDESEPPKPAVIFKLEQLGIALTRNGTPISDLANVAKFLEMHEVGLEIWHDEFYHRTFKNGIPWEDIQTLELTETLQREYGFRKLGIDVVNAAVEFHAHRMMRNEPKQWLNNLEWDKFPRIANFFVDCMGAESSIYMSAIGHNFWVGMVARIFSPGCQNDHMVVLEGPQNTGKTSALRIIGGRWYVELSESLQSKDFFMVLNGRMIVEIAELDAFNRAEVTRIKQVISCPIDSYRLPYARRGGDYARTCVFVGTTNEDNYLRDATGARRFWPVKCNKIDLQLIKDTRSQLFAEAVQAYKNKDSWHIVPTDETAAVQESRRDKDAWEDILADRLSGTPFVTLEEAAKLLGITTDKIDRRTQQRLAIALKKSNYRQDQRRIMGRMTRGWEHSNGTEIHDVVQ